MAKLSEYRSLSRHFSHRVRGELFESRFAETKFNVDAAVKKAGYDVDELDSRYNISVLGVSMSHIGDRVTGISVTFRGLPTAKRSIPFSRSIEVDPDGHVSYSQLGNAIKDCIARAKKILKIKETSTEGLDLHEKEMASSDLDLDNVYNLFSQNYLKATGKTWTKDKFLSRAHDWTFFGSEEGMVAVRKQRSGLYKLVGSAGKPLAVAKGFKELIDSGAPVWGAVSADLLPSLKKAGMKSPPAWVVRTMIKHIPAGVWGGITPTVNKDGSITLDYADVGPATKFFIGSPAYYRHSLKMVGDKLPSPVKAVMEMYAKGKEVASGALSKFKSLFSKSSDSADEEEA